MKTFLIGLSFLLIGAMSAYGQTVDVVLVASDGDASQQLHVGLDPDATDGLDAALGEAELPPMPPAGVFEARLTGGALGQGSYRDYRTGGADFEGDVEHSMQWQLGGDAPLTLDYDLPDGITLRVTDFFGGAVLDRTLEGQGSLTVENKALTSAKLTVSYGPAEEPNTAPTFTSTPGTDAEVGVAYAYSVTAEDSDGDALTLSASTLPDWLSFTDHGDGTATLGGTPDAGGAYDVALSVSDGTLSAEQDFTIDVEAAAATVAVDVVLVASDGDASQQLHVGLDPDATDGLDAALGEAELPPMPPAGVFEARLTGGALGQGSYRDYRTGGADFEGDVEHSMQWQLGGDAPLTLDYDLPDGITLRVTDFFGGAVLDRTLEGQGTLTVENKALTSAKLTVSYGPAEEPNTAPTFTSTPGTDAEVGVAYAYSVTAEDSDGDPMTITAPTLPDWLSFTDNGDGTATLGGTPDAGGAYDVALSASDGTLSAEQDFTIDVEAAAATVAVDLMLVASDGDASQQLHVGLDPDATDGLDAALGEAELPPMPPAGVFEARLTGGALGQGSYRDYRTGGADFEGDVEHSMQWQLGGDAPLTLDYDLPDGITLRVTDFFGGAVLDRTLEGQGTLAVENKALTSAKLTVSYGPAEEPNTAPTFTSTPTTEAQVDVAYTYSVTAEDSDGDPMTITAPTLPDWLSFTDNGDGTATLGGTPDAGGAYDVVLSASDGTLSAEQDFTIDVEAAANTPPHVMASLPDTTLTLGQQTLSVDLSQVFDDPDGDPLTFTASSSASGVVSVEVSGTMLTATASSKGDAEITVTASDGKGGTVEVKFNVHVPSGTPIDSVDEGLPSAYALGANHPNPFGASTTLTFALPKAATVHLAVYDVQGRAVATLADDTFGAGHYTVRFDAPHLPSGIYLCRMQVGDQVLTRKLTHFR